MMRLTFFICLLMLTACFKHPVHQGNVIKPEELAQIRIGDSRYYVERMLGTPLLKDVLHPKRATYVEYQVHDEEDIAYQHRVEIEYNDSDEVASIRRFGFDSGEATK